MILSSYFQVDEKFTREYWNYPSKSAQVEESTMVIQSGIWRRLTQFNSRRSI